MILTPERYAEVTQPGACYVVRWVPCHPRDQDKSSCEAGFFSLFIRALYGIRFATQYNLPYHIDYGHMPYSYSDPGRFEGNANFWNYYFVQPIPLFPSTQISVINTPYETFPLRIWNRSFSRQMHEIICEHIKLRPNVASLVQEKKERFNNAKVLGVHIRRTDHPGEVEPVALSVFKRTVHREIRNYDKVFVATDDLPTLEEMVKEFGPLIIHNDVKRSTNGSPVHRLHPEEGRYELGLDALLDCYCLSFCQKAILLHSNLSYASLLLNPGLDYTILETSKHRNLRIKTSSVYYLDKWIPYPKRKVKKTSLIR